MSRRASLLAVSALLVLAPVICVGHEMGTTRVALVIDADRYRIDIVTDAQTLADRMAAVWKQTPGNSLAGPKSDQRFAGFGELLLRRVAIRFDGVTAAPAVAYSVSTSSPGVPASMTITLSGAIPVGTRVLQWNYGWTDTAYAFAVHRSPGEDPAVTWLEGGQVSAPVVLDPLTPAPPRWQAAGRYLQLGFGALLIACVGIYWTVERVILRPS